MARSRGGHAHSSGGFFNSFDNSQVLSSITLTGSGPHISHVGSGPVLVNDPWDFDTDGVGTDATVGVSVSNDTAAAAGAQQYSPVIDLIGAGWKTDATAASQVVKFGLRVRPVQGAAAPTALLDFLYSVDGGAYASKLNLSSTGSFNIVSGQGIATPDGSGITFADNARFNLVGSSSSLVGFNANSNSVGILLAPKMDSQTAAGGLDVQNSTFGTPMSASANTQSFIKIDAGGINQSGTAGYNLISATTGTETSTGSGTKYLINLMVATTPKFLVNNAGSPGFFGAVPLAAQVTCGADLTNSVTSGGAANTIGDVVAAPVDVNAASLTSTRDAIYRLAVSVKLLQDWARDVGCFT